MGVLGVLPGDKMFQAQRLNPCYTRSVILHGGANRDIPRTLPGLAEEGWVLFACYGGISRQTAAMVPR